MFDAVVRHLLSNEYGPLDRLIELGVFLLIFVEVVVGLGSYLKRRNRKKFLEGRREWLSQLVAEGEKLRHDTPPEAEWSTGDPALYKWIEQLDSWSGRTVEALKESSPKAAVTFNLFRNSGAREVIVYTPNKVGRPFQVSGQVRVAYERLVSQLGNLTEIVEKSDVYF
jgi:hypothetical protein